MCSQHHHRAAGLKECIAQYKGPLTGGTVASLSRPVLTMRSALLLPLLTSLISCSPLSTGNRCQPSHGQCTDLAMDFIREVASLKECRGRCADREGCQYYGYNKRQDGPHSSHCYLYSSCSSLRTSTNWVTGTMETHPQCHSSPFIVAVHNLLRPM